MNRRHFLHSIPALAVQAAARPIRTAIWGTQHSHTSGKLRAMKDSPLYEVAAVCENDPGAKSRALKDSRFQGLPWMSEEQLLNDRSLQLIVVECGVWDALPMGQKVIAADKHLHLEKPPGNTWAPFKALVEEARRKKLLLQTGYLWRCYEGVSAALDAARKGWLGDVLMVRGTMNSDRDATQRAVEAKYKGGGLFELGGHVSDRIVELLGRPVKVQSWLRHHTSIADTLADNNLTVLEYEKSLAVVAQTARMSGSGDHRSFEIIGSDGTVMVWPESSPPRMRVHVRKAQGPYKAGWQDIALGPQPRFVADFQELARAIAAGQPLKLSYDHELLLHETLLRASGELA
ncbi:MAG: Gfo/Idh/MocA family oxidoreductase [Acidobacteriota bacterium]